MELPFENESLTPSDSPFTFFKPINNPDDLVTGLLYDVYFNAFNKTKLKSNRRTRMRARKGRLSRRTRQRHSSKNFGSHAWAIYRGRENDNLLFTRVHFIYHEIEPDYYEGEIRENEEPLIIHVSQFQYANLETLYEKMEDPYFNNATMPFKTLFAIYLAKQHSQSAEYAIAEAMSTQSS